MPPKRQTGAASSQPPLKLLKAGVESRGMEGEPDEGGFRLPEDQSYFINDEQETIDFDEELIASPGIRTDTISLLMKIEQLQTQLKYERRCRILAERELRELKEMNTLMMQMRHTAHELRVTLDHVLQGGEPMAAAAAQNPHEESTSFLASPDKVMRPVQAIPEGSQDYLYLTENLQVPKNLYERIAEIGDYKKYTSALLMLLFDRQTLATHSIQGRKNTLVGEECTKPQLPPQILGSIIDHVSSKFGVDRSQIKTAIRTKLNNEDKLLKKRLGMMKAEPKVPVEANFSQDASLLPDNIQQDFTPDVNM